MIASFTQKIEVEARSAQEAVAAAESGADIVMLDNFSAQVRKQVNNRKFGSALKPSEAT